MSGSSEIAVILQDAAGEYYLITRGMLDQARATPEQVAILKGVDTTTADDTGGHLAGLDLGAVLPGLSIVSPHDPASGLPTGKRQHKPLTITAKP